MPWLMKEHHVAKDFFVLVFALNVKNVQTTRVNPYITSRLGFNFNVVAACIIYLFIWCALVIYYMPEQRQWY
jgi:hypothetical protein